MAPPYAFVTLITSDAYLPGALALVAALNDLHPSPPVAPEVEFQTVCLVTPETVDVSTIKLLRRAFNVVIGVELITQRDAHINLQLLGRPDLHAVLTKLHVFRLTEYSKVVFLDADVLPIRPMSHLLTLPYEFSAVPDVGWPDIFNSGVLVLTPGEDKFNSLSTLLQSKGTWDGGDQGILNEWRGNDWNRLSFTYNTTPTGVYSYAPAYERFGSEINAVHFIGQNKPWNSLLYREPGYSGAANRTDLGDRPFQAYDYDALVDKWYAVYDKHYRAQLDAPSAEFDIKKYTPAWDKDLARDSGTPTTVQSGAPLGLEELRRIAVEGTSTSVILGITSEGRHPGEGQYKSLPLEGRVDLMRPRHEEPKKEPKQELPPMPLTPPKVPVPIPDASTVLGDIAQKVADGPDVLSTPAAAVTWHINLPEGGTPVRMYTLPTPAPHEIPSTPHFRALPLPLSLPATPSPIVYMHSQPEFKIPVAQQPPVPVPVPSPPRVAPEEPSFDLSDKGLLHLASVSQDVQSQAQRQQSPHAHQKDLPSHREPRPASPPLVPWNPAVEPPPTETPPVSAFPLDSYFSPQTWDQSPGRDHHREASPWYSPAPDAMAFFEELPPTEIPEMLVRQGDYIKVTGEQESGTSSSPDRKKPRTVFPWEDKPRQVPRRHFPSSEMPSGTFLETKSPSPLPTGILGTPERQITHGPIPSPLSGLPSTLNYANAWDSVPSIQRYASRLARPSPPPALLAPAFDVGRRRRGDTLRSWADRMEASSRDGDDEDNADESDENLSQQSPGFTNDSGSDEGTYRRKGSLSPRLKKEYVSVGVQTEQPEMKDKEVQVETLLFARLDSAEQGRSPLTTGDKHHSIRSTDSFMSPTPAVQLGPSVEPESLSKAPTLFTEAAKATVQSQTSLLSGTREFPHATSTPTIRSPELPHMSPLPRPPVHTATPPRSLLPPVPFTGMRSLDSPSLASPLSSIGPLSPPEGMPVPLPARKGGRVWDPARDVNLLRRDSEEVLSRFLRMGSWEDDVHKT